MFKNFMELEIEELVAADWNYKTDDERKLDKLMNNIKRNGQIENMIVRKLPSGFFEVVNGNHRLKALRKLGIGKAVVYNLGVVSQAHAIRVAIETNETRFETDKDKLAARISEITQTFSIDDLGLTMTVDIPNILASIPDFGDGPGGKPGADPDAVPPTPIVPRVKPGEIWKLGPHRLMCGSSTDRCQVEMLMNDQKASVCFTSPPYNAGCFGYDDGKSKYKQKGGDSLKEADYFEFLVAFTDIALDVSDHVLFNNQFLHANRKALARFIGHYAESLKDVFPWIKNTAPPNVQKGVFTNRFEFFLCLESGNTKKGFPVDWQGKYHNIIEGATAAQDNVAKGTHAATMPVYVPLWFIERLPFIKTIYEPFAGTGTTLIACEMTGRACFAMEIDPAYCTLVIDRWEKFTGLKAVLDFS